MDSKTIAVFVLAMLLTAEACKISVKMRSKTKEKFKIQILVPGIMQKTERVTFNEPGEKKVEIEGEHCQGKDLTKKWMFQTWKEEKGEWLSAHQEQARIDGNGHFVLIVGDDLKPMMGDRLGVFCGESILCAGFGL